jgi:putative transposase
MRKVCGDFSAEFRKFNGQADHVHLLVDYPSKVAVSALVNSLKGGSARRLRSKFTGRVNQVSRRGHFWSPSYLATSCGGAPLNIIRLYIEQQQCPA